MTLGVTTYYSCSRWGYKGYECYKMYIAYTVNTSVCIPLIVYTYGCKAPLLRWGTEWNCSNLLCKHTSGVCVCVCVCVSLRPQEANQTPTHYSSSPHEEEAVLPLSLPYPSILLVSFTTCNISAHPLPPPSVPRVLLRFDVLQHNPLTSSAPWSFCFLVLFNPVNKCRTCLAVCSPLCFCV